MLIPRGCGCLIVPIPMGYSPYSMGHAISRTLPNRRYSGPTLSFLTDDHNGSDIVNIPHIISNNDDHFKSEYDLEDEMIIQL